MSEEAPSTTTRIAKQYDEFAPRYDSGMRLFERVFIGDGRRWVGAKAQGDVLEIAIGTGRNLPYYDRSVRIVGIDISPAMLEIAQARARKIGIEADLGVGDAQQLSFANDSFDSVVSTASMCTIPDYRAAIGEAWRVLRPGGQFLLLEHVRSPNRAVRAIQRLLDPLSVRFMCDHLLREPADVLRDTGFGIERLERSKLGIIERVQAWKPA